MIDLWIAAQSASHAGILLLAGSFHQRRLFPLIGLLGTTHEEWPGALILAVGISLAGILAIKHTAALETRPSQALSAAGVGVYLAILVLGLLACLGLHAVSATLARAVYLLVFVGFLEEFFFRGYLQSRLNDAFGRPFRIAGVELGTGLFLSGSRPFRTTACVWNDEARACLIAGESMVLMAW